MFHSIGSTFKNATTNSADVKELIPELFYQPEMLVNNNKIQLGERQDGVALDSVLLPPWASDAYDFVSKHRQALESEFVSDHLAEWVDLVFGCNQKGTAAEEHLNLFYHLTYEGAVNLDAIVDEQERKAIEAQILNFGNTPSQLTDRPCGARQKLEQAMATICTAPSQARDCKCLLQWVARRDTVDHVTARD